MPTTDTSTHDGKIVLGSGFLYIDEYSATSGIPADATLEVNSNILGYIKGGATLEYTPTKYTAIDDMGRKSKTITTDEVAKLIAGIMTWNGNTLQKICSRARVTTVNATSSADGKRTVKIGGGVDDGKNYVLRFVHHDEEDGDVRVTIVGKNEAGMSILFAADKETTINTEFRAIPHDSDGTLIIYEETIPYTGS